MSINLSMSKGEYKKCEYKVLNNTQIKNFKPQDKLYRNTDSHGLVLKIKPNGVKAWRYRCRIGGKAAMLSLGDYPSVSLAEARRARDDLKIQIKSGIDPRVKSETEIPEEATIKTFSDMYQGWYEHNFESWSEGYAKDLDERCQKPLLSFLQVRNIA